MCQFPQRRGVSSLSSRITGSDVTAVPCVRGGGIGENRTSVETRVGCRNRIQLDWTRDSWVWPTGWWEEYYSRDGTAFPSHPGSQNNAKDNTNRSTYH